MEDTTLCKKEYLKSFKRRVGLSAVAFVVAGLLVFGMPLALQQAFAEEENHNQPTNQPTNQPRVL